MSFITGIEHAIEGAWRKLFGAKTSAVIDTIMTDIHDLFQKAEPIVSEISAVISAADLVNPSEVMTKMEAYLGTVITDGAKVDEWVTANLGQSIPSILENAAVLALSTVSGTGILADLKEAITLAFAVYRRLNPTTTGTATVAAVLTPVTVPAPSAPSTPVA